MIGLILRSVGFGLMGLLVIVGGLYLVGYQIKIVSRSGQEITQAGLGKGSPGWRRGEGGQAVQPSAGSGQRGGQGAVGPGSGQRGGQGAVGPGSGQGSGQGRGQAGGGRGQQPGQPGFGPTGGILLPIRAGTDPTPVLVNGKELGSFVGKDLMDHVEDTVVATSEGPRKGWGLAKTLTYLGVKQAKEVTVFDQSGKRLTVTAERLQDNQTPVLLTYDATGLLLLVSGPKVRGTNKGMVSREQVIQMVAGRKDLLDFLNIVRIEVKG